MPLSASDSSRDPESIHTPIETERTWGIDSVKTSRPFGSTVRRILRAAEADLSGADLSAVGNVAGIPSILSRMRFAENLQEHILYCYRVAVADQRSALFQPCIFLSGVFCLYVSAGRP